MKNKIFMEETLKAEFPLVDAKNGSEMTYT